MPVAARARDARRRRWPLRCRAACGSRRARPRTSSGRCARPMPPLPRPPRGSSTAAAGGWGGGERRDARQRRRASRSASSGPTTPRCASGAHASTSSRSRRCARAARSCSRAVGKGRHSYHALAAAARVSVDSRAIVRRRAQLRESRPRLSCRPTSGAAVRAGTFDPPSASACCTTAAPETGFGRWRARAARRARLVYLDHVLEGEPAKQAIAARRRPRPPRHRAQPHRAPCRRRRCSATRSTLGVVTPTDPLALRPPRARSPSACRCASTPSIRCA